MDIGEWGYRMGSDGPAILIAEVRRSSSTWPAGTG